MVSTQEMEVKAKLAQLQIDAARANQEARIIMKHDKEAVAPCSFSYSLQPSPDEQKWLKWKDEEL